MLKSNVDFHFTFSKAASMFFSGFVSAFTTVYFVLNKKSVTKNINTYLNKYEKKLKLFHSSFYNFVMGQIKECGIFGIILFVFMVIFRFPSALFISLIACVFSFVPLFGTIIACVVGALIILSETTIKKSIEFLILYIILQQIEGRIIYPKVVGKSVGLPGFYVFLAVILGSKLFGILGTLFLIPIFGAMYSQKKSS